MPSVPTIPKRKPLTRNEQRMINEVVNLFVRINKDGWDDDFAGLERRLREIINGCAEEDHPLAHPGCARCNECFAPYGMCEHTR